MTDPVNVASVLPRRRVLGGMGGCLALLGCGPPRLTRAPTAAARVVVIGAGLSGLAVAQRLEAEGLEVHVVEAAERPGGRIRTHVESGIQLELGATRLPANHTLVSELAAQVDLKLVPQPSAPADTQEVYLVAGERFVGKPSVWPVELTGDDRSASLGELAAKYIGPGVEQLGDPTSPAWPGPELANLDALRRRDFIRQQGGSDGVVHLLEMGQLVGWVESLGVLQSLRFAWGNDFSSLRQIEGGNERLVEALARATQDPIRYGAAVRTIRERAGGVVVELGDGPTAKRITADFVVCCVPLSALARIAFDPPLSALHRQGVEEVPYVNVVRLSAIFEGRPWLSHGLSGEVISDDETMEIWDLSAGPTGPGVLTAYVTGQVASRLAMLDEVGRARWLAAHLARALPGLPRFERTITQVWPSAWPAYRPNQLTRFLAALSAPTRRVAFAGEHLSPWPGWMQGSVASAHRAAEWVAAAAGDLRRGHSRIDHPRGRRSHRRV